MVESVFELVAAAADVFFGRGDREDVFGADGVAWFAGRLVVDFHGSGHDGALGFLAAIAKPSLDQSLIQTAHEKPGTPSHGRALRNYFIPAASTRAWASRKVWRNIV